MTKKAIPTQASKKGESDNANIVQPSESLADGPNRTEKIEFLRDHVKDARTEMLWRRDIEFRLLQLQLVFYSILATAIVAIYQTNISPQAYWVLSIGAILFIFAVSIFVTDRIRYEHQAYSDIGKSIQVIWAYFGMFEKIIPIDGVDETVKNRADKNENRISLLPEKLRNPDGGFGLGRGYRKTITLIWVISITMIMMIVALTVLKMS